jgi:hypothetical protein
MGLMNKPLLTLAAASVLVAPAAAFAVPASAATTRQFEGTVVSVNRDARTFRLNDSERGTKRIKVTSRTSFERITFASLRRAVTSMFDWPRRSNGRWVALQVERSGGGGSHGGDDHGGDDD